MLFISLRPAYVRISHVFFFTVSVWVFCEPFCFKIDGAGRENAINSHTEPMLACPLALSRYVALLLSLYAVRHALSLSLSLSLVTLVCPISRIILFSPTPHCTTSRRAARLEVEALLHRRAELVRLDQIVQPIE